MLDLVQMHQKAKQATSRQKQLDKLDIQAIEVSSRRDPSIIFRQKRGWKRAF